MSILPEYRRNAADEEDGESAPLFKGARNRSSLDLDLEAQVPAYPPRLGESSSTGEDVQRGTVTYTFVPRWPMKGDKQDAIGVMGRNKAEAIAIVQGGFATLAAYPADRIEFLAPIAINADGNVVDGRWGIILDDAWPAFAKTPPAHLKVQIQDAPGEEEARAKHEGEMVMIVVGALFGVGLAVIFIVWLCGGFKSQRPPISPGKA